MKRMVIEKGKKFYSNIIIAHQDADGLLSSVLLMKEINAKPLFASPYSIKRILLSLLLKLNANAEKTNLWLLDLAPEQKTIFLSSLFKQAIWIDHHEKNKIEFKPRNVRLFIQQKPSCFGVVKGYIEKYFNKQYGEEIGKEISLMQEIADEIDVNKVKSEIAENFRSYIGWFKWKYRGIVLKLEMQKLAKDILAKGLNLLKEEDVIEKVKEYNTYLEEKWKFLREKIEIKEINNFKVAFIISHENFPVYYIFNNLKEKNIDLLVFAIKAKKGMKFELRSFNDFNTLLISKQFGGGGHKKASGGFTMLNENAFKAKIERVLNFFKK